MISNSVPYAYPYRRDGGGVRLVDEGGLLFFVISISVYAYLYRRDGGGIRLVDEAGFYSL